MAVGEGFPAGPGHGRGCSVPFGPGLCHPTGRRGLVLMLFCPPQERLLLLPGWCESEIRIQLHGSLSRPGCSFIIQKSKCDLEHCCQISQAAQREIRAGSVPDAGRQMLPDP